GHLERVVDPDGGGPARRVVPIAEMGSEGAPALCEVSGEIVGVFDVKAPLSLAEHTALRIEDAPDVALGAGCLDHAAVSVVREPQCGPIRQMLCDDASKSIVLEGRVFSARVPVRD